MSPTEVMLLAVHRTPLIPLSEICDRYFNVDIRKARGQAALNQLPVPAWRLVDSRRAPLMVRLSDLAAYIDTRGDAEKVQHAKSQI